MFVQRNLSVPTDSARPPHRTLSTRHPSLSVNPPTIQWSLNMSKPPVRVAVTGAAGQIGYSILFRIAAGDMLGKAQPVILQMLEIPDEKAQKALAGVMMELNDCAFPLLAGMMPSSDPMAAFKDADFAILVGARPRTAGMERKDRLEPNGALLVPQGKPLGAA